MRRPTSQAFLVCFWRPKRSWDGVCSGGPDFQPLGQIGCNHGPLGARSVKTVEGCRASMAHPGGSELILEVRVMRCRVPEASANNLLGKLDLLSFIQKDDRRRFAKQISASFSRPPEEVIAAHQVYTAVRGFERCPRTWVASRERALVFPVALSRKSQSPAN
ncbi:unnamed protein product [Symbiodinium natans]|uniref:Uncharacterized protein n=1 Tax=Symbiodinium natans TaxID=878477 RepID=A0A812USW9_9DINO|nr:unnamed protein product [Symbiodinium natans]